MCEQISRSDFPYKAKKGRIQQAKQQDQTLGNKIKKKNTPVQNKEFRYKKIVIL